jgi:hypothetical protein
LHVHRGDDAGTAAGHAPPDPPDAHRVSVGVDRAGRRPGPLGPAKRCRRIRSGLRCAEARFREVLDGLETDLGDTVFIDYGSGAGRAVLLAATYPFKEVVGIEQSPALHERAQANLSAFPADARQARAVRLVCADAAAFALPADPAVLYFYNPFREGVMRRVLAEVETSLLRTPRTVTIVLAFCYKGPREAVERSRFFRPVSVDRGITILRSLPMLPIRRVPDRSTA